MESPVSNRIVRTALVAMLGILPLAAATGNTGSGSPPEVDAVAEAPAQKESSEKKEESSKKDKPRRPKLRGGLSKKQMDHAVTIVKTGQDMGLPRRAYVVAIATAMQESRISVLANTNVPHSFKYKPRDGYGRDHDSVGIFQQRVKFYCVNDLQYCMDPRRSAMKFYNGLKGVKGWKGMPVTVAAQRVQGSAFPDAYAKHTGDAKKIVAGILKWQRR